MLLIWLLQHKYPLNGRYHELLIPYPGQELICIMVPVPDVSIHSWLDKTRHILGNAYCLIHAANRKLGVLFRWHVQFGQIQGWKHNCTAIKQPLNPMTQNKFSGPSLVFCCESASISKPTREEVTTYIWLQCVTYPLFSRWTCTGQLGCMFFGV